MMNILKKSQLLLIIIYITTFLMLPCTAFAKPKEAKKAKKVVAKAKKSTSNSKPIKSKKAKSDDGKEESLETTKIIKPLLGEELKEWKKRKKDIKPEELKNIIEENHRLKIKGAGLEKNLEQVEKKKKLLEEEQSKKDKELEQNTKMNEEVNQFINHELTSFLKEYGILKNLNDKDKVDINGDESFILNKDGSILNKHAEDHTRNLHSFINLIKFLLANSGNMLLTSTKNTASPPIKGVVFKVQIGAYRKKNLSKTLAHNKADTQHKMEQNKTDDINVYTIAQFRNYEEANKLKKELRVMGLKDAFIRPEKDGNPVPIKDVLDKIPAH